MIAAWEALARADLRAKDYAGAIESANKALELAPDETDMYAVQYEAYKATGDKAKAAEAKKKLPADASSAFNDAVKLLNDGKDAEAEPLLKQAIAADDKFAPAYYELGMIYVRSGKSLQKRITEISVQFKHVPTSIFKPLMADQLNSNVLHFRLQPNDGIAALMNRLFHPRDRQRSARHKCFR